MAKKATKKRAAPAPAVKHTPGPWKAWPAMKGQHDESGRPMVTDESGAVGIAHVIQRMRELDTLYPEEAAANARLIAAAPDLLAVCVRADALLSHLMKSVPWGDTFNLDIAALNGVLCDLPRAIAKATGAA